MSYRSYMSYRFYSLLRNFGVGGGKHVSGCRGIGESEPEHTWTQSGVAGSESPKSIAFSEAKAPNFSAFRTISL